MNRDRPTNGPTNRQSSLWSCVHATKNATVVLSGKKNDNLVVFNEILLLTQIGWYSEVTLVNRMVLGGYFHNTQYCNRKLVPRQQIAWKWLLVWSDSKLSTSFVSYCLLKLKLPNDIFKTFMISRKAKVRFWTPKDNQEQLPAPIAGRFPSCRLRGTGDDVRSSNLWSKTCFLVAKCAF